MTETQDEKPDNPDEKEDKPEDTPGKEKEEETEERKAGLVEFCVNRPVATMMIYLGLALTGLVSWFLLPRELFPDITFPELTVLTKYANAAPEEIENMITKIVEESVSTVPNLKRVRSSSKEGVSMVTLEFNWGTDMGFAHLSVREKLDQIKDRLPLEADEPIVQRVNPFSHPVMIVSVTGRMSLVDITDLCKRVVKQRLEKVNGVASAIISGGQEREILIEVDRDQIEARKISLLQVVEAIKQTNLNYPAGTTQGKFYEYLVRTIGLYKTVPEIKDTLIPLKEAQDAAEADERSGGRDSNPRERPPIEEGMLNLGVIAGVKDTVKKTTSYSRYNGQENVSLGIQKQSEANTVQLSGRVKAAIEELQTILPKDVEVKLIYDESTFIQDSIAGIRDDAITGGIIAMAVLYFFLGNVRDSLIVGTSIPVSICAVFAFMYFKGISLNILSIGGLGLAVGNFVDNSIVVVENTARHRIVTGGSPIDGAKIAASEVYASMFSSMLTQNAVFVPLMLIEGIAQQLFSDMFMICIVATVTSAVVSVTLIPRLCAYPINFRVPDEYTAKAKSFAMGILHSFKSRRYPGFVSRGASFVYLIWTSYFKKWYRLFITGFNDEQLERSLAHYEKALRWVLSNPRKLAKSLALLSVFSVIVVMFHNKTFMPRMDQGEFLISIEMPVGTKIEVTNRVTGRIEDALLNVPDVKDVTVNIGSISEESVEALGPHQANCIIKLKAERRRKTEDIIANAKAILESLDLEGGKTEFVMQDNALKSAFEFQAPVMVEIKGQNLDKLNQMAEDIKNIMNNIKGVYGAKSSVALPAQETQIHVDKDRATGYQLSVSDIAKTALIAVKGFVATKFKLEGKEIDVRVQLKEKQRSDISALNRLTLRGPKETVIPLAEVARFYSGRGPSEIQHLDQQRSVIITAQVLKRSVNAVLKDLAHELEPYTNITDYSVVMTGERKRVRESFGGLGVTLAMSVLLVYMVMAGQFESLIQPLIIICTVPFSFVGIAITIWVTQTPLSAPVILGAILLGGVVVNNGIILIDFINQNQSQGNYKDVYSLVIESCKTRVRPIMMTMLTSVLGVLPLAVGLSEGSELSSPLAVTTLGGLFVSTLLTLLVIPFLYITVDRWIKKRADEVLHVEVPI